jgi:hypothetical protein
VRHIPDATNPKAKRPISSKLKQRWVGPYKIIAQINPVLYTAEVNGTVRRVHAIAFMDAGGFQNALAKERK